MRLHTSRAPLACELQSRLAMSDLLRVGLVSLVLTGACTDDPSEIVVSLAPDLVSSLDGTLTVRATLLGGRSPIGGETLDVAADYTDRNGTMHPIPPASGTTDDKGVVTAVLGGLTWDGSGTVTVTGAGITGTATFAVLDRTPPHVTITPPAASSVQRGTDITVAIHATDEIGISQVFFGSSYRSRERSLVTSGAADLTLDFDFQVPDVAPGTTITLSALAEDMSGNQGAAMPITVTVVP